LLGLPNVQSLFFLAISKHFKNNPFANKFNVVASQVRLHLVGFAHKWI